MRRACDGSVSPVPTPRITVHESEPGVLVVSGEIDAHCAPLLESRLRALPSGNISLDMSGVAFMDSSGLRVLVGEQQRRSTEGGQLTVTDPSVAVARLLALVGLAEYFDDDTGGGASATNPADRVR